MTNKLFLILIIFINTLVASEDLIIEPKYDLMLRYNNRNIDFSNLGKNILKRDNVRFSTKALGGDIGLNLKSNNFNLIAQGSGVFSLTNLPNDSLKIDRTYFDNERKDFFYLSNLYLQTQYENTNFKIGRQQYNNQLVNRNKKLISNQYQGLYFDYNKEKLSINSLYFNKVSSSTVSNVVPFNHNYGVIGYGKGYKVGEFVSISKHISNKDYNTNGALVSDIKYGDKLNFINLQNLYIDNFFNTTNLIVKKTQKYNNFYYGLQLGFIKQFDVGENYFANDYGNKKIDNEMYQGKVNFNYKNVFASYTYAYTPYDKDSVLTGTMVSPFSNKIGWIVAPQTAHSFISDTKSNQFLVGTKFNISKIPTVLVYADSRYNLGKNNGLTGNYLKTREQYLHLKMFLSKSLNMTFQYSQVKNIDLLVKRNNNIRTFINYTF